MEGDLGKLIVAKGFEICPKCNKLPNLVTLPPTYTYISTSTPTYPLHLHTYQHTYIPTYLRMNRT